MLLLTGFGLGCLTILLVAVLRDFNRTPATTVFLLILLASCGFLLHPLAPPQWQWLTLNLEITLPALFWLFCQTTFGRRLQWFSIWSAMALYSVIAPWIARVFVSHADATGAVHFFGWQLGEIFEFILIGHGLWLIIAEWSADLVESRRQLRAIILCVVGAAVSWGAFSLNLGVSEDLNRGLIVSIAGLAIASCLLKGKFGALYDQPVLDVSYTPPFVIDTSLEGEPDEHNEHEVRLNQVMHDGFYRTEHLTLKMLADKIQLPEYKTRALINKRLGYRNFNEYVNQLRIHEASHRLLAEPQTPILNIALDIGYRSLSSFNRAFKDITKLTPSEFRREHLQVAQPKVREAIADEIL